MEGISFTILLNDNRDSILNDSVSLVSATKSGVLLMRRESKLFFYGDYEFNANFIDFYLKKGLESIPYFDTKLVDSEPRPKPVRLLSSYTIRLDNNMFARILILVLIATHTYNKLLTKSQRSVFVDETWLFMEIPSIVGLFKDIARRGRKYEAAFMYISQRVEDLAKSQQGRMILEQNATSLILRQKPEGRDTMKQICKLSDTEADFLINAPTGIPKAGEKEAGSSHNVNRGRVELLLYDCCLERFLAVNIRYIKNSFEVFLGGLYACI